MGKRGPPKGKPFTGRTVKRKPYADMSIEKLPLWYHELIYEAATYTLNVRQLATKLQKNIGDRKSVV
jgi:hypothetical protein